jgi:hypothetical protein
MYYIETAADVRKVMTALEDRISEAGQIQSDTDWDTRKQF